MHVFVLLERVAGCCLCASICIKVLITTCCGFITVTLCVLLWDLAREHEAGVVFFSTGSRFGHSYFLQQPVKVRITWGHFIHVPLEYPCWAPAGSSPVPVVPGILRQHSGLDHNDGSSSSCTLGSRRCEEMGVQCWSCVPGRPESAWEDGELTVPSHQPDSSSGALTFISHIKLTDKKRGCDCTAQGGWGRGFYSLLEIWAIGL